MDESLRQLEHEVEAARARLASDLSALRSPTTFSDFTDNLKHEALDAKDLLVEKAKSTAQSTVQAIIDDLKAKAAANPGAALAIGAGLAWRFVRHPPIATALIGAGLFSLLRTTPIQQYGQDEADHLSQARERFGEQASEMAEDVKELAQETAGAVKDQTTKLASAAKEAIVDAKEAVAEEVRHWSAKPGDPIDEDWQNSAFQNPDTRDKLLLGAAGLAVAAAVGLAFQRRLQEQANFDDDGPNGRD